MIITEIHKAGQVTIDVGQPNIKLLVNIQRVDLQTLANFIDYINEFGKPVKRQERKSLGVMAGIFDD